MITFLYPQGKTKALTLSYDDGAIHDRRLVEIFNKHGLKGTFHLNSAFISGGDPNYITAQELQELYAGHEVACHAAHHPYLTKLPTGEVMREIWEDRLYLEKLAGYPVTGMSYPFGAWDEDVIAIAKAAGIVYSRSASVTGGFSLPQNFMHWDGTCHHDKMLEIAPAFLEKSSKTLLLMYVWGHSFEFDRKDNWEDMEKFASMVSGQPDVWYATNMEIYRYIQSVRSLEVSADGSLYRNPGAETVWGKVNGEVITIAPGALVRI